MNICEFVGVLIVWRLYANSYVPDYTVSMRRSQLCSLIIKSSNFAVHYHNSLVKIHIAPCYISVVTMNVINYSIMGGGGGGVIQPRPFLG